MRAPERKMNDNKGPRLSPARAPPPLPPPSARAATRRAPSKQICGSSEDRCRREKTNKRQYYTRKYIARVEQRVPSTPRQSLTIPRMSRQVRNTLMLQWIKALDTHSAKKLCLTKLSSTKLSMPNRVPQVPNNKNFYLNYFVVKHS